MAANDDAEVWAKAMEPKVAEILGDKRVEPQVLFP
jgi:hypothetical protein